MRDSIPPAIFGASPNPNQLAWQEMGAYAFIHFTVNTFTDCEWGDGTENPNVFNPSELDCEQWCRVISQAGFKGIVLTAKHHDGFCLWPSKFTKHTVASSSWRNGKGDVVGALAEAAKKYDLKLGLYLSPWDRHEPSYGSGDSYNKFYRNQLRELLTTYGGENGEDIFMTWFDGACGEGPNGKVQVYDFDKAAAIIRECAPKAVIMGHMGFHRDVRWCGNEHGYAGSPNWATMNDYQFEHLNHGEAGGRYWWPSEVDVSIRPGWFYHEHENVQLHSLEHLLDIWYQSVGRGSCLNLNFPPDRRGLIHENDAERVRELKIVLDKTFAQDFALKRPVTASIERGADFAAAKLTDNSPDTYWAPPDGVLEVSAIVELKQLRKLNVIRLREHTQLGQRVVDFAVDYRDTAGDWQTLITDSTIGFRKENIIAADNSYWLTASDVPYPHRIVIDTGRIQTFNGFIMTPPTLNECRIGAAAKYRLYVGVSPEDTTVLASEGCFDNMTNNPIPQVVTFATPVQGRYLRLEGLQPAQETCRMSVKGLETF